MKKKSLIILYAIILAEIPRKTKDSGGTMIFEK